MSGESAPYGEEAGEEEREEEAGEEGDVAGLGLPYSWESPGSLASLELQEGAVIEALLEFPGVDRLRFWGSLQAGRKALHCAIPGHQRPRTPDPASRARPALQCTRRPGYWAETLPFARFMGCGL